MFVLIFVGGRELQVPRVDAKKWGNKWGQDAWCERQIEEIQRKEKQKKEKEKHEAYSDIQS